MKCPRCRTIHTEPAKKCRRCATALPRPRCKTCKAAVDWGRSWCDRHQPEELRDDEICPACGVENDPDADYCADCGSPMAVITRVLDTSDGNDRPEPWRVYGVETELIGRDDELDALEKMHRNVESSSSLRVAVISGREGLGKSRLLAEYERRLEASFSETAVLRDACRPEVGGAFSVISRMLRSRFYLPGDDNSQRARRRLFEAVDALVDDRADEITRLVAHLIGLAPSDDDTTGEASPRQMERASFQALAELLRADAKRNPLLLIFDDFHHAPDPTRRLLHHLVERLEDSPIFFVVAADLGDDDTKLLPSHVSDLHLQLAPLSDAEVRHQIKSVLRPAEQLPRRLIEDVVDAALGHPLTVEEMLRIFISEGIIDTRREPWSIDADRIDEIELPTTVEETVEARLNGLTDAERRALEMASCVGTLFWGDLVACLDRLRRNIQDRPDAPWLEDNGDDGIRAVIESLERKDMIRRQPESRLADHEEFIFKHRLEREHLYEQLPARLRKRYHRLTAQWIERHAGADGSVASEFIARHYARAGCLRRAARHYLNAGDEARGHHANQEAIALYLEALGCLTDADLDLKMRACHDLGSVYSLLGDHRQAVTYFEDMARYAWLSGNRSKCGAALNRIGRALREKGRYDESLRHFERALELFRSADDERGVASTLDDIGKIHWVRGDQAKALDNYSASLEMRRSIGDDRSLALSLSHMGSLKLSIGKLPEAMKYLREALQLRRGLDDPRGLASSYNDMGGLCTERGDYEKALPLFEKALRLARKIGFRGLQCAILNNMGEALIGLKRRDEARERLDEAKQMATDIGHRRVLFDIQRNLATLAISEADRSRALERIDRAMELARELDSRSYLALGELTRAEIHAEYIFDPALRDESIQEASAAFRRAISLLGETGVETRLADALSKFGHFLVESGNHEDAVDQLERAAELFEKLEMDEQRREAEQLLATAES